MSEPIYDILKVKDDLGIWHVIPALKGDRGNGIASIQFSQDGTMTITDDDGEVTTYTGITSALAAIGTKEQEITAAELSRELAEQTRAGAEAARQNSETIRRNAETVRNADEALRRNAESARDAAELQRASAESTRQENEATRQGNENTRQDNEAARAAAETSRATAETGRATAETARQTAEAARASAEEDRETLYDQVSGMTADAETLTPGSSATATKQTDAQGNINFHFGIPQGAPGETPAASIAADYSSSETYEAGNYAWHSGLLYRCNTDIDTAEEWTAAHWTEAKLADDVEQTRAEALGTYHTETLTDQFVASFDDGADDIPVKSLIARIEPVQNGFGTPSPDNVMPISGWTGAKVINTTGVNLFNPGITPQFYAGMSKKSVRVKVKPGTYTATAFGLTGGVRYSYIYMYVLYPDGTISDFTSLSKAGSGTEYSVKNITVQDGESILFSRAGSSSSQIDPVNTQIVLVEGANQTINEYIPYTGNTYDIAFPSEAGTVYGGTLDVTNGILTAGWKKDILDDSITWHLNGSGAKRYFACNRTLMDGTSYSNAICNILPTAVNGITSSTTDIGVSAILTGGGSARIAFRPEGAGDMDVATFKAYLEDIGQDIEVCYKLKDPSVYQLTPVEVKTLLALNNIWAGTGNVDITYRADPGLHSDNVTSSILAMIAPTEEGLTATRAYSANDLLIVGRQLYKATTSIANGGTITPGTNVTATTLGEQIIALLNA